MAKQFIGTFLAIISALLRGLFVRRILILHNLFLLPDNLKPRERAAWFVLRSGWALGSLEKFFFGWGAIQTQHQQVGKKILKCKIKQNKKVSYCVVLTNLFLFTHTTLILILFHLWKRSQNCEICVWTQHRKYIQMTRALCTQISTVQRMKSKFLRLACTPYIKWYVFIIHRAIISAAIYSIYLLFLWLNPAGAAKSGRAGCIKEKIWVLY